MSDQPTTAPTPDPGAALLKEAAAIWALLHEAAGANMNIMRDGGEGHHDLAIELASIPEQNIVDLVNRLAAALSSAEAEAAALRASLTWATDRGVRAMAASIQWDDGTNVYPRVIELPMYDGTDEGRRAAVDAALTQARQG